MRPARMPSPLVKVRPWYYTERNQPSRIVAKTQALDAERRDDAE